MPNFTTPMSENEKPAAVILQHPKAQSVLCTCLVLGGGQISPKDDCPYHAPRPAFTDYFDPRHQPVKQPAEPPSVGRLHFGYDTLTEAQFDNLQICEDLNGMMDAYGLDRIVRLFATVCQGRGVVLSQYLAREVKS